MTIKQVQALSHGVYMIYWKSGGTSVASVGSLADGTRWLAPTNWVHIPMDSASIKKIWRDVKAAEKLDYKLPVRRGLI